MSRALAGIIVVFSFAVAAAIVLPLAYMLFYVWLPKNDAAVLGAFLAGLAIGGTAVLSWFQYKIRGPSDDTQRSIRAVNAMKRYAHDGQVLRGDTEGPNRALGNPKKRIDQA